MVGGVVLVLALVAGAAVVLLGRSGGDDAVSHPERWDPRVEPIAEWVADERDLEFLHPVEVVFLGPDEYRDEATGEDEEVPEEEAAEMEDFVGVLRALGLVHGEVDLGAASQDLAGDGTLAYYDFVSERIVVRGTELSPAVRVTLAHELTHVLQDQHFDLARMLDPEFDRSEALRAIAEGDAGRIEDAYAADELTDAEREEYEEEAASDGEDADAALADVPPALVAFFAAPYSLGEGFVTYMERIEGGDVVDDLLADPPSEQELLDPSARGTARVEPVEVAATVPDGVDELDEDELGPLGWYLILASRGDPVDALRIVDGWGGDHMVVYRDDGALCVALTVVGDDAAATDRFAFAAQAWAGRVPGTTTSVEPADGEVRLRSCDPGADAAPVGEVATDLLVVPYLRADIVSGLVDTADLTLAHAECTTDRLLTELTVEQLTAPQAGPDVQRTIQAAVLACA